MAPRGLWGGAIARAPPIANQTARTPKTGGYPPKEPNPTSKIVAQTTVWLDTNFVIAIGRQKIDLRNALELELGTFKMKLTPAVAFEINERLNDPKTRSNTRLGLHILQIKDLPKGKKGMADDELAEKAQKNQNRVATLDRALHKRIKAFGGQVIYLKDPKRVAFS